jgi:uncharacterized protein (DUF2336 family)
MQQAALNKEKSLVIDNLEREFAAASSERRASMMRSVTDLFLTAPAKLTDDQIALFDDVLNKLINRLEEHTLAEVSERLAQNLHAPPEVMRRLASDDSIAVAGPALAQSARLTDKNLIDIAERKSQSHLGKIAERRQLSEKVTDVLVDRGNDEVVRKVAANAGASFSSVGMSTLVMRADGDDSFIEIISQRTDIPSLIYTQLLSYATDQTRKRLMAARRDSEAINLILAKVSGCASRLATMAKDWAAAHNFVQSFGQDTELTRTRLLEFADGGRVTELVAALSVLSGIETHFIGRLICDQSGFGVMILCKTINVDWATAHAVLSAGPGAEAHAGQLEELCRNFEQLSLGTARRLLGFWYGRMRVRGIFDGTLAGSSRAR